MIFLGSIICGFTALINLLEVVVRASLGSEMHWNWKTNLFEKKTRRSYHKSIPSLTTWNTSSPFGLIGSLAATNSLFFVGFLDG